MNKRGMSFMTICIVLLCLTVGFAVQQSDGFNVESFKNNLTWTDINITVESAPDLGHAFESLVNGLGECYFSIAKWAAQWSSENPQIPFQLLIYLLIFSIIAPIIIVLFKLLVIIFLLTKEFFDSKKEKKMLNKLKGGKKYNVWNFKEKINGKARKR